MTLGWSDTTSRYSRRSSLYGLGRLAGSGSRTTTLLVGWAAASQPSSQSSLVAGSDSRLLLMPISRMMTLREVGGGWLEKVGERRQRKVGG